MILRGVGFCLMMVVLLGCQEYSDGVKIKKPAILDSFKKTYPDRMTGIDTLNEVLRLGKIDISDEKLTIEKSDSSLIELKDRLVQLELMIQQAITFLYYKPEMDGKFTNEYFIGKKNGGELFERLQQYKVQTTIVRFPVFAKNKVDSMMNDLIYSADSNEWIDRYFKDAPPIATIQTLLKFQQDTRMIFFIIKNSK